MKLKVLLKLMVVLVASAMVLLLGTAKESAYGGMPGLYGGNRRSNNLVFGDCLSPFTGLYGVRDGMDGGLYGMYGRVRTQSPILAMLAQPRLTSTPSVSSIVKCPGLISPMPIMPPII